MSPNPSGHVLSVTEVRNALRCPRAFALGRRGGRQLVFPLGSSCLGATFHRLVDRFASTVKVLPESLGRLPASDAKVGRSIQREVLRLLARELMSDPAYAAIPGEVDDLAEACRQFSRHVAHRLKAFPGSCFDALPRLFRSGEQSIEAYFPEAGSVLQGRIDALFGREDGTLEVVEYKLTDEQNEPLDRAQVVLYRELLRRSQIVEARPVILRFMPGLSSSSVAPPQADHVFQTELLPLLQAMPLWAQNPESAPPARCPSLCSSCPLVQACRDCGDHLSIRDDPPASACRLRPGMDNTLQIMPAATRPPLSMEDAEGRAEAEAIRKRIQEELTGNGIAAQGQEPIVGPTLFMIPMAVLRGSVQRLDRAAPDVCHRLEMVDRWKVHYEREGARRAFWIQRPAPRTVLLADLLSRKASWLRERPGRLVIGQQPDGTVLTADLADAATPHLLVAGSTGSGKSWLLKAIVASLVHFHEPSALRITLIDPKRVTFNAPRFQAALGAHLDRPTLCDVDEAIPCFEHFRELMEERYHLFEDRQVQDLHDYNRAVPASERLPRHVVVMDEYENLILDKHSAADFQRLVHALGAKARAAGIHLILATQRPDRSTVNGAIRANLTGKIALRVSSQVNSRIILDAGGAEGLLGKGDLLADLGKGLARAQAAVIDG